MEISFFILRNNDPNDNNKITNNNGNNEYTGDINLHGHWLIVWRKKKSIYKPQSKDNYDNLIQDLKRQVQMHNVMAPQKDNSMASTYEQNKCVYTQDLEKKLRRKDTQPPTTTR